MPPTQADRDQATIAALRHELVRERREAQHQVRNVLAVVRAIVRRTVEEGEGGEHITRLDGRLASFARVQTHILCGLAKGVDLFGLIADELLAFDVSVGAKAHLDGPPACLTPRAASVLGLAFHELARMAIEDGSSAGLDGRIDVRWWRLGGEPPILAIDWIETGRRANDRAATGSWFAREMVEGAIGYELGGAVAMKTGVDGLVCRFFVPLEHLVTLGATPPAPNGRAIS